jgi:hypothetical protein
MMSAGGTKARKMDMEMCAQYATQSPAPCSLGSRAPCSSERARLCSTRLPTASSDSGVGARECASREEGWEGTRGKIYRVRHPTTAIDACAQTAVELKRAAHPPGLPAGLTRP